MTLPYELEWPVDQAGYDLELDEDDHWMVQARGGPPRYYRPMEVEGLWRRFADQCVVADGTDDRDGILAFVSEFGLLAARPPPPLSQRRPMVREGPTANHNETIPLIGATAALIRKIAEHYDKGEFAAAAKLFNAYGQPKLTVSIASPNAGGRFEYELVPTDLRGALLLQTVETITGNYEWRRCRNEGCPVWFRIGLGGKTKRREFCSTRCRVASAARRHKSGVLATGGKRP
jgi:hypothetical protein